MSMWRKVDSAMPERGEMVLVRAADGSVCVASWAPSNIHESGVTWTAHGGWDETEVASEPVEWREIPKE